MAVGVFYRKKAARFAMLANSEAYGETAAYHGVLGLRPHARSARRPDTDRRHRAELSQPARGRDLFPHAAPSRIRRRRDLALFLHGVSLQRESTFHRHPDFPFALLPPFLYLYQPR